MPDYGHELQLGAFITPRNDQPADVVALAQLSERSGLDLVTFQDHPYQPAFLDTWTLLSYVAAQTERVRLAPNFSLLEPGSPRKLAVALEHLAWEVLPPGTEVPPPLEVPAATPQATATAPP